MPRPKRVYPPGLREMARTLRQQGFTYREIIAELGGDVPKNTLSVWVSDIELTTEQQDRIRQIELDGRARGRPLAAEWHHEQKRQRLQAAEEWAKPIAEQVSRDDNALLLMAAALWQGEGEKRDDVLGLGNSDPAVIKGWMALLRRFFQIEESQIACQLHISEGMPEEELKLYWSEITGIPLNRFHKTYIDIREKPKKREGYKGVCKIVYFSSEARRRLGALSKLVLDELANYE